jgi:hypothetical protein
MRFACRLCERVFETIPAGSIEIGRPHGFGHCYRMVRFPDGTVHDLRKLVDPPEPANELLAATIQALLELPTPEPEPQSQTAMSIAFRRANINN